MCRDSRWRLSVLCFAVINNSFKLCLPKTGNCQLRLLISFQDTSNFLFHDFFSHLNPFRSVIKKKKLRRTFLHKGKKSEKINRCKKKKKKIRFRNQFKVSFFFLILLRSFLFRKQCTEDFTRVFRIRSSNL